jgi:hypothetical protein
VSCPANSLDSSRRNPLLYLRNLGDRTLPRVTIFRCAQNRVLFGRADNSGHPAAVGLTLDLEQ